jgi:serine protease Do
VAQVQPGSPAERAGIQRGDVITRFAGQDVGKMRDLPRAVAQAAVGQEVEVVVLRGKERKTLRVKIEAQSDERPARRGAEHAGTLESLGLRVQDLTPELRQQLGVAGQAGVLIADVDPAGPAAAAGLREGDVVLEADRKPIASADELGDAVGRGGDHVLLLIQRGGQSLYVVLERR